MAWPARREFTCPLCATKFSDDTVGEYEVRGFDDDLRPLGSVEAVRRYSLSTCPSCLYTDYGWDWGMTTLEADEPDRVEKALKKTGIEHRGRRGVDPMERFTLAEAAFTARRLDREALGELCLLAYYVARDLRAPEETVARWRDRAAAHFSHVLAHDAADLGAALTARSAYVTGELLRRAGDDAAAREAFEEAVTAAEEAESFEGALDDDEPIEDIETGSRASGRGGSLSGISSRLRPIAPAAEKKPAPADRRDASEVLNTRTIARLAKRAKARMQWGRATLRALIDHTRDDDRDRACAARILIAERRDPSALAMTREVYDDAPRRDRREMLARLAANEPPASLFGLYETALGDDDPDIVVLAAKCVARIGDARALAPLIAALDRHGAAVAEAVCGALRRTPAPDRFERVEALLADWLASRSPETADGGSEPARKSPSGRHEWSGRATLGRVTDLLKEVLYVDESPAAVDLMIRELEELGGRNDLWEKPPSYSPVPFLLRRGAAVAERVRPLLLSKNEVARRWAARILGELGDRDAVPGLRKRLTDDSRVVRLEAGRALAAVGVPEEGEKVVVAELADLGEDFPFALHFLVPFQSQKTLAFLLDALRTGRAVTSEVLPLLGRHAKLDAKLIETLEEALASEDEEERAGAVTGLSFVAPDGLVSRLIALYDGETDLVRRRLVYALGRLVRTGAGSAQQVLPVLRRALREPGRDDVSFAAAVALLELGDGAGLELARERAEAAMAAGGDDYDLAFPALRALETFAWSEEALALDGEEQKAQGKAKKPARASKNGAPKKGKGKTKAKPGKSKSKTTKKTRKPASGRKKTRSRG